MVDFIKKYKWLWIYAGVALFWITQVSDPVKFTIVFTVCSLMVAVKKAQRGGM